MLAIARRGAADSLGSGITTTADYSFSGAAAAAAAELGLRAIVYLEVFAGDPPWRRASSSRDARRVDRDATSVRDRDLAARALHLLGRGLRWCLSLGIPVGTHLAESASENEWLEHGTGPLAANSAIFVAPIGQARRRDARPTCSAPSSCARTASSSTPEEIALLAEHDVPVAHCPRSNALLGCGIAPLAELLARRPARRPRHRLAGLDAVVRPVRGAPRRRLRRAGARAAARCADRRRRALALATIDARARPRTRRRGRQPRRPASGPT